MSKQLNWNHFLQPVAAYWNKFVSASPRERLVIIGTLGILLISAVYVYTTFMIQPPELVQPLMQNSKQVVANTVKSSEPILAVNQPSDKPLRNPFEAPPEFRQNTVKPGGNPQTAPGGKLPNLDDMLKNKLKAESKPTLVGVVEGNGTSVAIIQNGGESRSYQIGERVGSYRISDIETRSVVLEGAEGSLVLILGR